MATTVFYQPFGHLEEVPKIKERKVVGYKCKFCVEVHPTLRAICNHLRKHVQYGNVPSVSAAVKVRRGRSRYLVCMYANVCARACVLHVCIHVRISELLINPSPEVLGRAWLGMRALWSYAWLALACFDFFAGWTFRIILFRERFGCDMVSDSGVLFGGPRWLLHSHVIRPGHAISCCLSLGHPSELPEPVGGTEWALLPSPGPLATSSVLSFA